MINDAQSTIREKFEAWAKSEPFGKDLSRFSPKNGTWPGQYKSYDVQFAWEAFQFAHETKHAK